MDTPSLSDLFAATRSYSVAGALAVSNAILTSFATTTSPMAITVFTGTLAGSPGATNAGRTVSVTTASNAATYAVGAGNAITVTGTDDTGNAITDTLALVATGGGETIVGVKGFATVTSIAIPAQLGTNGHFTFGVQDLVLPSGCRKVRIGTTGNLHVGYADGSTDVIPAVAAAETLMIAPTKIFGDSLTTASNVTALF